MQGRCRRMWFLWLAVLLAAACGALGKLPQMPAVPRMSAAQRALNRITGGTLDAEAVRMMRDIGPTAVRAVGTISDAVVRFQGEFHVRAVLLEEESRLVVAAAQSFYTDECTSPTAAPSVTSAAPDNLIDLVKFEREAGEAFQSANYERAGSLLQQVYNEKEKQLGADHPVVLRLLNKRAALELAVNNYKQASVYATAALNSREQSLKSIKSATPPGRDEIAAALAVGESASTIANIYRASSAYSDAKQSYERAIELRTRYLGADHLCAAQSQSGLGELLEMMGDYPAARRLFEAALVIRQGKLGPQHRDTALSVNDLASLHRSIGDLGRAQELSQRALDIRRKLGEDDVDVATSHNDLGEIYKLRGDYANAESEYRKALEIRQKKLGEGIETAQSQNALANLCQTIGDYRGAQDVYRVVRDIRQKILGPDHPDTAESLNDLGDSHLALGDHAKAESEYNQALDIRRNKLGPDHPLVARSLVALGNVHVVLANYTQAESEYNQALDIQQKKFGPDHPDVAQSQHQLGVLHQARGDYARAESFYRAALSLREKKLGGAHPSVAESLTSLARLMMATGRYPQALEYVHRASGISEQLLQSIGAAASGSRLDALLRLLRTQEEIAYSLPLETSPPADAAMFAMSVALLRKGRSLDEAADASRATYQSLDSADREKLAELQATRAKLGALIMSGSGDADEVQHLRERADELEQALAKHSARLRARRLVARPEEIVTRVAQVLPPDGVLVEIVAFRPVFLHVQGQDAGPDPLRYLALVLHHDASVRVVPLGLGEPTHKLIGDFRAQLAVAPKAASEVQSTDMMLRSAEALYRSVFQPVRAEFAKADKNIFLSLDSELHLVPFAALFDGNQYLVETYQFTYLTSGRDLLRADVGLRDSTTVAVIANPEFIKGAPSSPAHRSQPLNRGVTVVPDGLVTGTHDAVPSRPFRVGSLLSLPGTVEEAQDIRHLLPETQVFWGKKATKDEFLRLQSPGILHVATHALFRSSTGHAMAGERTQIDSDKAALLDSILMLAGAGVKSNDGTSVYLQSEGVATALEVAGMNLWGTQLVVLSACETGVGDVSNLGQGVYGLRRAVMMAGAETLVTSLWPVGDRATRQLMVRYYENLLAGQGRVEAMRDAADSMRKSRKHPHYWASFIVIGSRDPLIGIGKKYLKKPPTSASAVASP